MTPRGGPTLDFSLFGRYFLDLAVFYPGAFLCLAPLWEHVKAPRRTAVLAATLVTVICLASAALCAIFELDSNILLLPTLLAAFWLLRWRVGPEVSVSQTAFLFAVSGVMMAVCSLLSVVLNARAEVGNDAPACLVSTFSQVEQLLRAQENFLVCNRGVILNMDKVLRLDCDCFEMLDGTCLPVRQKDKNTLFAQFTQYQFRHMRREL